MIATNDSIINGLLYNTSSELEDQEEKGPKRKQQEHTNDKIIFNQKAQNCAG